MSSAKILEIGFLVDFRQLHSSGHQSLTIMKISGHKAERDFLEYILISHEETAEALINDPNFNKPSW